jgi:hypothetical protein
MRKPRRLLGITPSYANDRKVHMPDPLSPDLLRKMDAYWRAANYLSVGQIYLQDNPLLDIPLSQEHIKPRLLGHWGTTPGLNFLYVHLNRLFMRDNFKTGDRVSWNSEAGRVSGTIIRRHTRDFEVTGYVHRASAEAPQYEIKSSKTEHIAFHKGSALTKLRD